MNKVFALIVGMLAFCMQNVVNANFTDKFRTEYGNKLRLEYVEIYDVQKKNIAYQGPGFVYSRQGKNWFSMYQAPVYDWHYNSGYTEFRGYETTIEHQVSLFAESKQNSYPYRGIEIWRYDGIYGIDGDMYSVDLYNGTKWKMKEGHRINEAQFDLYTVSALLTSGEANNKIKFVGSGKEELFGELFVVETYAINFDSGVLYDDKKMKMLGKQNLSAKSFNKSLTPVCKLYYMDNGELVYFTSFGRDIDRDNGAEKMKVRTSLETLMYLNRAVGVVRPRYYQVTSLSKDFDVEGYNELKNCELKTLEEANAIVQQMANEAKANYEQEQQDVRNEMAREYGENRRQQVTDGIRQSKIDYAKMKIRQAPLERRMQRIKKK